jgi:hypothetical protein
VPFVPRAKVLELAVQALRNLKRMEVKLLMLDEVHNLLAGSAKEQRILLNALRYISNELQLSLVCLGIGDARGRATDAAFRGVHGKATRNSSS